MKKGVSPVIATVLLVGITITLGALIFLWGNMFFVALAPPANCNKVNFQVGIYENNFDIVNIGNENIYGVVIKKIEEGSIKILEEINLEEPIKSGHSYTASLGVSGNLLIIPIIQTEATEKKVLSICPDKFGVEVSS